VDLTFRCNLGCDGCPYDLSLMADQPPTDQVAALDFSPALFARLCDELQSMGCGEVILHAEGEALLHPHVFDLVAKAKSVGLRVTMITNGLLLDEPRIRALIDTQLDVLQVRLWASTPEQYERLNPGLDPANFGEVVERLELLTTLKTERRSAKPSLRLQQFLGRDTFQHFDAVVNLARKTGCDALSFSPFRNWRGEWTSFVLAPADEEVLGSRLGSMIPQLDALSIRHNLGDALRLHGLANAGSQTPPCYVGWIHVGVKVDGAVHPCSRCDQSLGNLHEDSLPAIWNGPQFGQFRRQGIGRDGSSDAAPGCNCEFCPYLGHNLRIHRIFKWFSPLAGRL
jgi:MoaA/NifB/PqqE/SkfB family radical SAM enzyme